MDSAEARKLQPGDLVHWHDAGGETAEPGADDGTVTEVGTHFVAIAWSCYKHSAMPIRPLDFEHCGQVSFISHAT